MWSSSKPSITKPNIVAIRISDELRLLFKEHCYSGKKRTHVLKLAIENVNNPLSLQSEMAYAEIEGSIDVRDYAVIQKLSHFFFFFLVNINDEVTIDSSRYGWEIIHETVNTVSVRSIRREGPLF